jgi:hypothetical protein
MFVKQFFAQKRPHRCPSEAMATGQICFSAYPDIISILAACKAGERSKAVHGCPMAQIR